MIALFPFLTLANLFISKLESLVSDIFQLDFPNKFIAITFGFLKNISVVSSLSSIKLSTLK